MSFKVAIYVMQEPSSAKHGCYTTRGCSNVSKWWGKSIARREQARIAEHASCKSILDFTDGPDLMPMVFRNHNHSSNIAQIQAGSRWLSVHNAAATSTFHQIPILVQNAFSGVVAV